MSSTFKPDWVSLVALLNAGQDTLLEVFLFTHMYIMDNFATQTFLDILTTIRPGILKRNHREYCSVQKVALFHFLIFSYVYVHCIHIVYSTAFYMKYMKRLV